MESTRTPIPQSYERKRKGYCLRVQRIVEVDGTQLVRALTTSGTVANIRWTIPGLDKPPRGRLRLAAMAAGLKVHGDRHSHPWLGHGATEGPRDDESLAFLSKEVLENANSRR